MTKLYNLVCISCSPSVKLVFSAIVQQLAIVSKEKKKKKQGKKTSVW